jgi:hypothetical protein
MKMERKSCIFSTGGVARLHEGFIHFDFEKYPPNRALFSALGKYVKSAFQVDFTYSSAASRRLEFSRGFQPTGWLANIPASRQRRLNFHATWRLCEVQSSLTRR